MNTLLVVIASGVLGLIGGAVTGSVKPLVDWHIEQKRELIKERKRLLKDWRKAVKTELDGGNDFIDSEDYLQLRPHLTPDEVKKLEFRSNSTHIIAFATGLSADDKLSMLDTAIKRVATKWGLD